MLESIKYSLILLTFPLVFLYPQGILYGTYLNYAYVLFAALLIHDYSRDYVISSYSFEFFKALFLLNLLGNVISFFVGNISFIQLLSGTSPILCALCLNYIIMVFPTERLNMLFNVLKVTFIIVLILILLDGFLKPSWLYKLYYFKESVAMDMLNTYHHRAVGSLQAPVMSGFLSASVFLYCFVKIMYQKWSTINLFILLLSLLALLYTASRTAMLALLLAFVFYFVFYSVKNKLTVCCLVLSFLLLLSFLDFSFLESVFENLTNRNTQFQKGVLEGTGRSATIFSALEHKFDVRCLLFGIGLSEYSIVEDMRFSMAHNGFLSIFLPFGLFGLYLHYRLYKNYLLFTDRGLSSFPFLLFISLWIILVLGTFFSADIPVNFFSLCLQAIFLALVDRYQIV